MNLIKRGVLLGTWLLVAMLVSVLAWPATGRGQAKPMSPKLLSHVSQGVQVRYYLAHPEAAPAALQGAFEQLSRAGSRSSKPADAGPTDDLFNLDDTGLPQNEESVSVCRAQPNWVLGSTNDYRGLLDPLGNFTGWHLSEDGGDSVLNEGLLPEAEGNPAFPSGGDPVDVLIGEDCTAYASSLNYNPFDPFNSANGIGVYKSDVATLASCPGGADPSCWPTSKLVVTNEPSHFLDKEWFHVGRSGSAGTVVWVTYSDFVIDPTAPLGFTSASIKAVRCDAGLTTCTAPVLISGDDEDVQFSDVTIGPDGRTYVTWVEVQGELTFEPQTFIIKMRVAPPGSTAFGPERIVHTEDFAVQFGSVLHSNLFRVATYPKNEVIPLTAAGGTRTFVVWEACESRALGGNVCFEPQVKLSYSDNLGASWTGPTVISESGDNYFTTIADDPSNGNVVVAYFTHRLDAFHARSSVELVTLKQAPVGVANRQIITATPNDTGADPLLGDNFIGDYIEVFAHRGVAYTHYNANYRDLPFFAGFMEKGVAVPVPQQDNYLTKRAE
jgi:hypothetical protein